MLFRGVPLLLKVISQGEFDKLFMVAWYQLYKGFYNGVFWGRLLFQPRRELLGTRMKVKTKYPIAYNSPDHIVPWGTKHDNSTHRKFILHMEKLVKNGGSNNTRSFLDLGCAGGQLVKDFLSIGWISVGLEGSDYSLKHNRANWPKLAGKNLFTCDITKPFQIYSNGKKHTFRLITAWEVLEHIKEKDLPALFHNIVNHLDKGGYFVASTTSISDIHNGIDLHQTRMTNKQWRLWLKKNVKQLKPVDLRLKLYDYVRYNAEHSFLTYRKNNF